jgi:hypothetical protein
MGARKMRILRDVDVFVGLGLRHVMSALFLSVSGLVLLSFPVASWADGVGSVTHLGGVLRAVRADGATRMLSVKSEIREGDTLKTEKNTYARIKFVDNGEVVLSPETEFKVSAYSFKSNPAHGEEDKAMLELKKGSLRALTGVLGKRSPEKFQMSTPTAILGVRGTYYGVLLCNNDCSHIPTVSGQPLGNGLYTDTAQGTVVVTNAAGSIQVPAGAFSYTPGPNVAPKLVPPTNGIQVTMPPAISSNRGNGNGTGASGQTTCKM